MQTYTTVSSPEVILQNGTAGTSTIYTNSTSAKVSVEAPLFDYVDNNDPDVDSSADKGMHSNFSAEQAGPDSTYDTLTEENTEAIEDYVDNNTSDEDSSSDIGTHSNFENQKAQDHSYDTFMEASQANTYSLDATGGYMIIGDGTPDWGSTTGTISFWVKMDTSVQGRFYGQDGNMETRWSGTNLVLDWGGTTSMTSAYSFSAHTWYFVAIVWDENSDDLFLYVGDENNAPTLDANSLSGTWTSTTPAPTENRFMNGLGGVEPVDGHGDDLRYWNVTRNLTEIQGDYNTTLAGSESGLRSYFKLDNNFDDSGPNNDDGSGSGSYSFSTDVPFTGSSDYDLNLEVQWTNVIDFLPTEKLCIYTGTLGSEDLNMDYWNGTGWENLDTDLVAYSCNEYAVSLTTTNFTIRFQDGTTSGDTTQDQWQVDASLLRVEGAGGQEDAVDQQSNVDGPADVGTHSNFTAQQYGPDSINDTLTEADTSASDNNNVDSEIITHGSTTGISGAQTVDDNTENVTEGAIGGATPVLASYEVNEANAVTSISVNKPSGTSSGDLLIILLGVDGTGLPQPSTPTGFTYITTAYAANGHTQQSWYREADGTEGASFSSDWSGGNNEDAVMACLRITGWDSGDFPHKIATNDATSGDPVFPAVTTDKDNCLLLRWYGMDDDDDTEPIGGVPSGHDEIFARATTSSFGETTLCACNRTWTTAGDTGIATWNQEATLEGWNTVTLAIAPPVPGYQLDVEHVVNSIAQHENYNLTTRAYRSAENFYLQLYNFSSSQWVNMSTITASSLTWYNMTLAKADFVNSTNQARIRYWQGADATQETLYVDYSAVYGWNATNYELDLEGHWTDLPYSLPSEELCIYAGAMGTEDIKVDVWNGSSWVNVISDINASAWNNVTIASYLTSSNFTIRFKGGSETGDTSQDTWQIDVALIHVWHDGGESYALDLEVQWTSTDYTRTNEELCIRTGTFSGSENIQVEVWNITGSSWQWVMNLTAGQWNNMSITSHLTSSTFTVQFLGGMETGDTSQDSWNIDATLLHIWTNESTWLSGWGNRVKLTVDHNDIESDLSDFPVLVHLSNSSGRKNDDATFIFDEVGANSKKIAVTESDGTTQCYVEIEKWDSTSERAWLWVKVPSISRTAYTDSYLYYDSSQSDNTAYVGDKESIPAQNVWNTNFKAIWHLDEDPSGAAPQMKDSTSNNNNGTSYGNMTTGDQVAGKIDGSLDFDGNDDYIHTTSNELKTLDNFTLSVWFKADSTTASQHILWEGPASQNGWGDGTGNSTTHEMHLTICKFDANNTLNFFYGYEESGGDWVPAVEITTPFSDTTNWNHAVVVMTGASTSPSAELFLNGVSQGTDTGTQTNRTAWDTNLRIGRPGTSQRYFDGIIDEVHISETARSAGWIKACYESGRNDLLDFGASGTSEGTYNYVLRVNNTVTDSWQIRLKKYSDSNVSRLQNCTIYFHNSTDGTSSQIIIENGSYINQTGPWYDLGNSETIYIAMAVEANSTGTSHVYAYLEILIPNTTTYYECVITFEIT